MPVGRKDRERRTFKGPDGVDYYLHADTHGGKHLKFSRAKISRRDFINKTKEGPAMFYLQVAQNYFKLLQEAIRGWVQNGATEPRYFKFGYPVGADNGNETDTVEITYTGKLGSHMRPKYLGG